MRKILGPDHMKYRSVSGSESTYKLLCHGVASELSMWINGGGGGWVTKLAQQYENGGGGVMKCIS